MFNTPIRQLAVIAILAGSGLSSAWARDAVRITIPRRSELTPVQRLNREGVDAVRKRQYDKAEALFLKAYLYDPADPFTLNNIGYISELQGQLQRAQKFYHLASVQGSEADIDLSNVKNLEGKPMELALEGIRDLPMRVNRMNVDSMQLLADNRGFEAAALLRQALALDPQNPFTLNNLGVADEAIGDYTGALKYYTAAAQSRSSEPAVVTMDQSWRGRSVSSMAAASAKRLQRRMQTTSTDEARSVMFNVRGVIEANENDWPAARQDFLNAYSVNPNSAFSLNNRGYVAERDGDLESAQFFYEKARRAGDSSARVGLATQRSAEGRMLLPVTTDSNLKVNDELDRYSQQRRRERGPIELTPRGNAPTGNSTVTPDQQSSPGAPTAVPQTTAPRRPQ